MRMKPDNYTPEYLAHRNAIVSEHYEKYALILAARYRGLRPINEELVQIMYQRGLEAFDRNPDWTTDEFGAYFSALSNFIPREEAVNEKKQGRTGYGRDNQQLDFAASMDDNGFDMDLLDNYSVDDCSVPVGTRLDIEKYLITVTNTLHRAFLIAVFIDGYDTMTVARLLGIGEENRRKLTERFTSGFGTFQENAA